MTSSLPLRVVDSDDCADHHYDDDSSNSSSENKGFLFTSFVDLSSCVILFEDDICPSGL